MDGETKPYAGFEVSSVVATKALKEAVSPAFSFIFLNCLFILLISSVFNQCVNIFRDIHRKSYLEKPISSLLILGL